jgi:glutathione S-transferase
VRIGVFDPAIECDVDHSPARGPHLIERGVIGGAEPNAADLQIATSVSPLLTMDDVRPLIEGHPAGGQARDIGPDQPGRMRSVS